MIDTMPMPIWLLGIVGAGILTVIGYVLKHTQDPEKHKTNLVSEKTCKDRTQRIEQKVDMHFDSSSKRHDDLKELLNEKFKSVHTSINHVAKLVKNGGREQ